MNLSQRQKRMLQWLGYPLLALVVFVFAVQISFPYERLQTKLIEMLREQYDVSIVEVGPTFLPGGLVLETVVLQTRPTQPDEEVTTVLIDELRVDISLLGLLLGRADVDVTAEIGGGSIDGNVVVSSDELAIEFATEGLPLETVPGLRAAVGLPMKGGLDASVDLRLPEQRWDQAEGTISLACAGCTVGDGEAKIKPRSPSGSRRGELFASQGMTVPELRLGNMAGKITIEDGKGVIEQLTASSEDGDLMINGAIHFGKQFKDSEFEQGCMRFRLTDELKQREPNFGNLPMLMGVALQEDGYANLIMKGKLVATRWLPATNCEEDGSAERLTYKRSGTDRPSIPTAPNPLSDPAGRGEEAMPERGEAMEHGGGEGEVEDRGDLQPGTPTPPPHFDNQRNDFPPPITPVPQPAGASGRGVREDDVRLREGDGDVIIGDPGDEVDRNDGRRGGGRYDEDDDDGEQDEAARGRDWEERDGEEGRNLDENEEERLEDEGEFE